MPFAHYPEITRAYFITKPAPKSSLARLAERLGDIARRALPTGS